MTSRYAQLLRVPHVRGLLAAELPARLPIGIYGLALVLFCREHVGSYGHAGLVAGTFGASIALTAPVLGRWIDRAGLIPVLLPATAIHVAAIAGVLALGLGGGPLWAILACAFVAGVAFPPLGSVIRSLWPLLLRDAGADAGLLSTALALDGVLIEVVFTSGPLLVALLAWKADPAWALVLAPVFLVAGLAMLLFQPPLRSWRVSEHAGGHGLLGAMRSAGVRTLVLATVPIGACLGSIEVTLPAFAETHGHRPAGGVLLAAWSLGSGVAGLAYGAHAWRGEVALRWVALACVFPLGYLPLAFVGGLWTMAPVAFLAGLTIAPVMTAGNQIVGDVAVAGTETEAYTWPITGLLTGIATGNVIAGFAVTHSGTEAAFLVATAAACIASLVSLARWRTLRVPPADSHLPG